LVTFLSNYHPPMCAINRLLSMSDMKSSKIILMVCAMVLMLSCFVVGHSNASIEVLWTQTFNPSNGVDRPISVALDSSGVYVVGFDNVPGNDEWRIEKRSLTDGALLWAQTNNPSDGDDRAFGVAVDSSGVYMVGFDSSQGNGRWRIEKRSLTDGALLWAQTNNPSDGDDWAAGVALDSSGVYVVGFDNVPGNDEWRIEKRSLTDGALLWAQTNNPSDNVDRPIGVAVDSSGIYVVGFDHSPDNDEWRIEKRSTADGAILWAQTNNPSNTGDEAIGVAVDSSGMYVVGYDTLFGPEQLRVEKRSLTNGALLWNQTENPSTGVDELWGVALGSSGMYVVGSDNSPSPGSDNFEWRIEKRSLIDGAVVWNQTSNLSNGDDWATGVALDATGIYIVGYDTVPGDVEWRIEKISELTPLPFYTLTFLIASVVIVIVAVILIVFFIMRRKAKLVAT
jgi:hypothetical protein